MISFIRKLINPFHIDVRKYPELDLRRRKKLLDHHGITKILDVGANNGQYGLQTIKLGFKGTIVSFEPVKSVFEDLKSNSDKFNSWEAYNFGSGDITKEAFIHISENTYSSSLLEIMPNHVKNAPASKIIDTELISIEKLDDVFNNYVNDNDEVLLKIDVQGFEKNVLKGAEQSLKRIKGIQIEMSIEELYKNEMLYMDMINYLNSFGYSLHSLENGFYNDETGKLLQVDGLFFRD